MPGLIVSMAFLLISEFHPSSLTRWKGASVSGSMLRSICEWTRVRAIRPPRICWRRFQRRRSRTLYIDTAKKDFRDELRDGSLRTGNRGRPVTTTAELSGLVERSVRRSPKDKIHPATRTFQALRIAVNRETELLEKFIVNAIDILKTDGRLAVITFHSLEDRIVVKHAFQKFSGKCSCPPRIPRCMCGTRKEVEILTRKPIVPAEDEIAANTRSRSGKVESDKEAGCQPPIVSRRKPDAEFDRHEIKIDVTHCRTHESTSMDLYVPGDRLRRRCGRGLFLCRKAALYFDGLRHQEFQTERTAAKPRIRKAKALACT